MKKFTSAILLLFIAVMAFLVAISATAQTIPQSFNYQAIARDNAGAPLASKAISVRLSITDSITAGSTLYAETHSVTTNAYGLFTLAVGAGTAVSGTFSGINWGTGNKFLKVEMDATGGSNYSLMGVSQLLSVPYALYAAKSGTNLVAGSNIAISNDSIINTAPNKVVTLTGSGASTVSGAYPNYIIHSDSAIIYNAGNGILIRNDSIINTVNPVKYNAGAGIVISNDSIINTAPNKVINLTGTGASSITGAYPNYTIHSDSAITYNAGAGITISNDSIINTAPNKVVNLTGSGASTVSGAYPNYIIHSDTAIIYNAGNGILIRNDSIINTVNPVKYNAGAGIAISNDSIINTSPNKVVNLTGTGASSVTGAYPNYTIHTDSAITYNAGNGITIRNDSIINTAPDKVVNLTGGGATTISGTYPNFTISSTATYTPYNAGAGISISNDSIINTAPNQTVTLKGTGTSTVSGAYPNYTIHTDSPAIYNAGTGISISNDSIINTAPNQVVSLTGTGAATISGTYPNYTIHADSQITYNSGAGIAISNDSIINTAPNQKVTLTGGGTTAITGSYPNFTISSSDSTKWKTSGNNIYNANSGNVGVGTSAPGSTLTVAGNTDVTGNRIKNLGAPKDTMDAVNVKTIITNTLIFAAETLNDTVYQLTIPIAIPYTAGMMLAFKADSANKGAAYINLNGMGIKGFWKYGNQTLNAADIIAGQVVTLIYDGNEFQLLSSPNKGNPAVTNQNNTLIYTTNGF